MPKYVLGVLAGGLLFAGCAGPRPVASSTGVAFISDCGQGGSMAWKRFDEKKPGSEAPFPKNYKSYEVMGAGDFFQRAKAGEQEVMIPLPAGCIPFKTSLSETMSPGLREKYPQLVSLKGSNSAGDDLRLDWNGTDFSGQVLAGGKTYLITHFPQMPATVYGVYEKGDAATQKQPFERSYTNPASGTLQQPATPPAER